MRTSLLIGLALMVASAPSQISKQGQGYLFRAKYVKGTKIKYAMKTTVSGAGQNRQVSSPISMVVKKVVNGVATIDVATGPPTVDGKPQGKSQTRSVQIDNRNRPVGGESGFEGFTSFAFPVGAIKPGATWTGVMDQKSPMGQMKLNAKYKFLGVKTVGGKQVAEIQTDFTGTLPFKMTGTSKSLLLLSDGSLLSAVAKMNMSISLGKGSQPMSVNTDMSVTRK